MVRAGGLEANPAPSPTRLRFNSLYNFSPQHHLLGRESPADDAKGNSTCPQEIRRERTGSKVPVPVAPLPLKLLTTGFERRDPCLGSPHVRLVTMAGAAPIAVGAPMAAATDLRPCPCVCNAVDALHVSSLGVKGGSGDLGPTRIRSRVPSATPVRLELSSAFMGSWKGGRSLLARSGRPQRMRSLVVVAAELGGQYEEGFEDVHTQLITYFTYKAVRTVLHQLYEMNPPKYMWFYNFVATNKPDDGTRFLRILGKEKQDLAERVMITRLHLYGKWIKKCDHAKMYQRISDENLELMRERLKETVIWPSDDTNTEKIG